MVATFTSSPPKVHVPKSWKKERIKATHSIYSGFVSHGGKGSGRGSPEIPQFRAGWRLVALEKIGHKWAYVIDTGTGTRAKIGLELWQKLVKHGRTLGE